MPDRPDVTDVAAASVEFDTAGALDPAHVGGHDNVCVIGRMKGARQEPDALRTIVTAIQEDAVGQTLIRR